MKSFITRILGTFTVVPFLQKIVSINPSLSARIRLSTSYLMERDVIRLIRLAPGWVFVDVGAYVGSYTRWASKQVGKRGVVIAIEPCRENFRALSKNARKLKNVRPVCVALWSRNETIKLYHGAPDSPATHSVVADKGYGSVNVRGLTLETLLDLLKISRVDAIKIDVEGAELEVLKGMKSSLKKIRVLLVEIHDAKLKEEIVGFLNGGFCIRVVRNHILGIRY